MPEALTEPRTKGDRRRESILSALEELLVERPIADVSVETIASQAGIARSGFYFYFESKYAALGAALARAFEEFAQAAAAFLEGTEMPPEEQCRQDIAGVVATWRRHAPLLDGMVEAAATDAGARALWEEWIERFEERVAERIEAERACGRAPAGPPDARSLAAVLLAMNERALYRARAPELEDGLAAVWLAAVYGKRLSA